MSRPKKIGLDYFPVDTVFDEKIQILESKFGNDGLCWLIKFWQMAYKTETGEVNTELFGELLANNSRITLIKQNEIILLCEKIGLLYRNEQTCCWTSNGIKKRISSVSKEREDAILRQEERRVKKSKSKVKKTPHYSANNFEEYKALELQAFTTLINDNEWIMERQKFHPNLDIRLSLEKAHNDFWGTEAGWQHKKKSNVSEINWKSTYQNALTVKSNQVWLQQSKKPFGRQEVSNDFLKAQMERMTKKLSEANNG